MSIMLTQIPFSVPEQQHRCRSRMAGLLLKPGRNPQKTGPVSHTDPDSASSAAPEDAVACRQCLHGISSRSQQQIVDGAHIHTFANPEGIVFEIACYADAWGCGYVGSPSTEFTWFAGYAWRIAVCGKCLAHLGWRFSSPSGSFFHGLIVSRILEITK